MLTLELIDQTGAVTPAEWQAAAAEAAPVLARAQAGEQRYADSLGWLEPTLWGGQDWAARAAALAQQLRGFADTFVVIGVGGSNNAARAVVEALDLPGGMRIVWAGNTLSPHAMNRMLAQLEGRSPVIDCIAKNFETLEPGASFRVLRRWLADRYGKQEAARRILCTGTPGSPLEKLAKEQGYTFLPFPEPIGGRFTALSPVHLVPMAAAGADVAALCRGAETMAAALRRLPAAENPALQYAVLRCLLWKKGYRAELLSCFEPRMRGLFKWWEQLFAESEGKDGLGLLPVTGEFSEQLHSLGQFIQDGTHILFETFLNVKEQQASLSLAPDGVEDGFGYLDDKDFEDLNRAAFAATRTAHSATLPCVTLTIDRVDEENLGGLFYFFQFACYLSAELLGVNPFDQPGVEAYKGWMFRALGKPGA